MPELPEVETVRAALAHHLGSGWQVGAVRHAAGSRWNGVSQIPADGWVTGAERRGKYLLLPVSAADPAQEPVGRLVVHLGMSGVLEWLSSEPTPARHERAWVRLGRGPQTAWLRLVDPRGFGGVWWQPTGTVLPRLAKLGPEPLTAGFTVEELAARLTGRRPVKAALLDQTVVAGLGNIYVDEALFAAGVHPLTPASQVGATGTMVAALRDAIVAGLAQGLRNGGTTLRDYRHVDGGSGANQHRLVVYGRAGAACGRCGQALVKLTVAGRGTTCCPGCQPVPPSA